MLLRMSEYATRMATLMGRQSSRRYPDGSMPYVFLIVIYTGGPRSSWNAPTEWRLKPARQPEGLRLLLIAVGYDLLCADDAKEYTGENPGIARTLMTIAGTGEAAAKVACRRLLRRLEDEGAASLDLVAAVLRFFKVIVVKRWPESEIAQRLAHIDTWRDVRSIGTEQKRMELEMTLTTFEREIAELKAEGRMEGHELGMTKGHELGMAKGRQLGMTDSLRRLVKRKYGQSAWERVSAFMQAAPSASVTPEMFDWLLECSSVEEFMGRMRASNGVG